MPVRRLPGVAGDRRLGRRRRRAAGAGRGTAGDVRLVVALRLVGAVPHTKPLRWLHRVGAVVTHVGVAQGYQPAAALVTVREDEGTTVVLEREEATAWG